jgi:hypothetical protein
MNTSQRSGESKPELSHAVGVAVGAAVPALLYLLYVIHYSVNVPNLDDWFVVPIVDAALHGHLTLGALWGQYGDRRLFLPYLIFVGFGFIDHLNEKAIIIFNATLFIGSYVLLLFLVRSYVRRRLTPACFFLGVVWFSLADVQNELWSFQLSWYLMVLFFMVMTFVLLIPERHHNLYIGVGIVAATAGSLSDIQGFSLWILGAICILWARPWVRRTYYRLAIWIAAAVAVLAIYLPGFRSHYSQCYPRTPVCSLTFGLRHPDQMAKFFVLLVGNVIPTSLSAVHPRYIGVHQLLGAALVIAALFVLVQTIRERSSGRNPLPLLLILFALLFDLNIALGRVGLGLLQAVNDADRYTMPNIILIVGILVYAWAHAPNLLRLSRPINWRVWLSAVGTAVVVVFVAVQSILTTSFGITNGSAQQRERVTAARIAVNLDKIPPAKRACSFGGPFSFLDQYRLMAIHDRLSVFQPQVERSYRAEGPPSIPRCGPVIYGLTPAQ